MGRIQPFGFLKKSGYITSGVDGDLLVTSSLGSGSIILSGTSGFNGGNVLGSFKEGGPGGGGAGGSGGQVIIRYGVSISNSIIINVSPGSGGLAAISSNGGLSATNGLNGNIGSSSISQIST